MDKTLMKIKILTLLLIISLFIPFGCSYLIPNHPTKPESEFHTDKKECDKLAREYVQYRNDQYRTDGPMITDQIEYSRRCLKSKGWTYRKISKD